MNETVNIWIDIALSDLNSSRLLYDNGQFRTSYFFFQQATEKANKSFALLTGLLNKKEFKSEINHNQLKIYKMFNKKQIIELTTLNHLLKRYPKMANHNLLKNTNLIEYSKTLDEGERYLDSLSNTDLVNIPTKELNWILNKLKKLKENEINFPNNFEKKFKKQLLYFVDWIGNIENQEVKDAKSEMIKLIDDHDQFKQIYDWTINFVGPMMIDMVFAYKTLFFCAIITIQHSVDTRYPIDNINPDIIYTKRLPIVKKQKEFMDLLQEAILVLRKLNLN